MDAVINDYTPKEVVPAAYTQDFNDFYKAYGINKTKSQSFIKWKKLNNQQKSTIMDLIPLYHNAFEVKFRKYPNNFLANNCWEDYMYLLEKKQQSEKTADKVAEAQKKRLDAYNY
tara:strand:- start:776 stop:1120 length:345 start_codon:yes stop_codon:yes gene_type:complete